MSPDDFFLADPHREEMLASMVLLPSQVGAQLTDEELLSLFGGDRTALSGVPCAPMGTQQSAQKKGKRIAETPEPAALNH